ncbi:class I SAM-dependent methyltransferase [Pectobacterium carotovorum]|uniref:class I SAM-dependent methyltransferase n=1 Tax=Pectobacterium carotovorum TaxID=554 RepID=UPI0021F336EF|nr:class I SAM-dependent methyltransferase [Pectobacterium carotovorum]
MNNADFDYHYQYKNNHPDTQESCTKDIEQAKILFDSHAMYPQQKNDKVLEVGCGMGRLMLMLQREGYDNITGIDIDKSQIEISRKQNLDTHSDAIDFLQENDKTYDTIYAFDVLEHIAKEKQLDFLKMVFNHTNDTGFIALSIPNALAPTAMLYRYDDFTHTTVYTENTISFLLHNAGFHFFSIRPQHQESAMVQELKLPWARLYRHESGMDNFILTPNLVIVAFKTKDGLEKYNKKSPKISNTYPDAVYSKARGLRRIWKHIKKMKF